MNIIQIYLLMLLKISSIFLVPHEKGLILPAKGLPSLERRFRVSYTFKTLGLRWPQIEL